MQRASWHGRWGRNGRAPITVQRSTGRLGSVRIFWGLVYISFTSFLVISSLAYPHLRSILQSRIMFEPYNLSKQDEIRGQEKFGQLSWTEERAPLHFSRSTKQNLNSELSKLYLKKLWKPPQNRGFVPCVEPSPAYKVRKGISKGFLLVQSNGGLNQMRAGICDMVVVARILNATLVIPELDKRSFWQDSSKFSDIFDEEYFIKALEGDVDVVHKLPVELASMPKARKQFRSWSNVKYYEEEIAPLYNYYKVIRATKSDSRLANNGLPPDIQKLRCRVHYDALRFAPRIEELGKKLLERMRSYGPYIALHLRYEKDMLAFSGCTHGLTDEEAADLTNIRETTVHWKVKVINATEQREKGLCPLTPKEVGIFLRSLGYPSSTRIYIAAGEIFGGHQRMSELESRFPNIIRKELIATPHEFSRFLNHSSQLAALDYIMSVEADVFVPSYSGNMARAVEGHRRYLGHRKTIIPDRKQLVKLFDQLDNGVIEEGAILSRKIMQMHKHRQGAPRKRRGPLLGTKGKDRFRTEEAFYNNPLPDCLCKTQIQDDIVGSNITDFLSSATSKEELYQFKSQD